MIYFDNAATTQMSERCIDAYKEYCMNNFYNPSALYSKALDVSNQIKLARNAIAKSLGASDKSQFIFTASGSEADNIAMFCSVKSKRGKIIVGSVEHSAIYNCANELKNRGFEVIFAPCDCFGKTDIVQLEKLLDTDVVLVSIMHVCNETGAINDLSKIAKLLKQKCPNAIFHSDGVQAYGKLSVNVASLGVDLYSVSAHKIHGPKGIGGLYVKEGLNLKTFVFGGGQESNIRSATENVSNIMAFEIAVKQCFSNFNTSVQHMQMLQKHLIAQLSINFDDIKINTNVNDCAPHIISFCFENARGEVVLHCLEDMGIIVGTGSACSAKKLSKRIPQALGIEDKYAQGMLRVSFCESNTIEEVDKLAQCLKKVVEELKNYQRV
ncbi:MAG: cysteine desulfurase family protein [Clostridia bacterium]